ncbi:MAG: amino acid ABC transporter permease, partial [Spirochaetales bacterium]|nr:amino acid ABC transporter permease [Spirochaetales bacterium]
MQIPGDRTRKKITIIDGLLIAAAAALLVYLAYRIRTKLNYTWEWSAISHYFFRRTETGQIVPNLLVLGLLTTLRLSIWAIVLAFCIGVAAAFFRLSKSPFFRFFGRV